MSLLLKLSSTADKRECAWAHINVNTIQMLTNKYSGGCFSAHAMPWHTQIIKKNNNETEIKQPAKATSLYRDREPLFGQTLNA